MKNYIINAPQLQSLQKRLGSLFAWAICWMMWVYLLVPLVVLSSWILGDKKLINEMRWFGGYKSLLELMQIYLLTLLIMAIFWLAWITYRMIRKPPKRPPTLNVVTDIDICLFYQVKIDELQLCRNANLITVYFDDNGHIIDLATDSTL
jgi:biofilm PGA synthesis protein PgaD